MPLAVFILVAMGALALTVSRFSGQTSLATAQEGISLQAFYAADAGAQYGLNLLFYVAAASAGSPITRAQADINCGNLDGAVLNFTVPGLNNCSTAVSCSVSMDAASATSFYTVGSVGTCGSGAVTASRAIEASSFMQ